MGVALEDTVDAVCIDKARPFGGGTTWSVRDLVSNLVKQTDINQTVLYKHVATQINFEFLLYSFNFMGGFVIASIHYCWNCWVFYMYGVL